MIVRSWKARRAKAAFFRHRNDVDVFVEDVSAETRKLFTVLLSNAAGGKHEINDVFPLGPRSNVLAACLADQESGGRPRAYVIDGDLDLCVSSICCCVARLVVLKRYCIENFLIEGNALAIVLANNSLALNSRSAAAAIDFPAWIATNAVPLRDLFLAYASARMLAPSIATVSVSYTEIVSDDSGLVDPAKVSVRVQELRQAVDAVAGAGEFDKCAGALANIHLGTPEEFMMAKVSGKDYLLPLARLRLNRIERITRTTPLLKLDLAAQIAAADLEEVFAIAFAA